MLGYVNYRHFLAVIEQARLDCFNIGQRVEDHFVGIAEMVEIGSGAQRPVTPLRLQPFRPGSLSAFSMISFTNCGMPFFRRVASCFNRS